MKAKAILTSLLAIAALALSGLVAWADNVVTLSTDSDYPEGTAGHWYVNMPTEWGDYTLTLSADDLNQGMNVFKVYDDGGKGGNYSSYVMGKLVICVPTGHLIQVSGTVWTKGPEENSTPYSALQVYDGDSNGYSSSILAEVLSPSDGEAQSFGPLNTTGNAMTLIFYNFDDVTNTVFQGLDLTVTVFENTLYNVGVAAGIEHGTVVASPTTAHPFEDITLTVTPYAHYYIGTVSYNDGTDHVITPENDVYSFKMPKHDVTVSATFLGEQEYLWGVGNDGSEEHPFVIRNKAGWDLLVAETQDDMSNLTTDKYFRLDADISNVTTGLGVFDGHLNGNHHKITLVGVTGGFVQHSYNATFRDLTIEGTVNTENSKRYVMYNVVNTNTNLTNCLFNVSSSAGYGLKGLASSRFTCTNCALLLDGNATFANGENMTSLTSAYAVVFNAGATAQRTGGIAIGDGDATLYADGFSYGGTEYFQEYTTVVIGCNLPNGYSVTGYSVSGATLGEGNTFTMPNHGVTVTITGLVAGTEQNHTVSLLSSSEQAVTKPGGWYAVRDDVTFSQGLTFSGDAYLLLYDGVTMTVERGITIADGGTLTVDGSGSLVVTSTEGSSGQYVGEPGQKGGNGGDGGAGIDGSLIVNGGTVNVTGGTGGTGGYSGNYEGGDGGNGGVGISGSLTVNGGTVYVTGGAGGAPGEGDDSTSTSGGPGNWGKKSKAIGGIVTCTSAGYVIQDGNGTNIASGSNCSSRMLRVMRVDDIALVARQAVFSGQTRYWTTFYHPDYSYLLPSGAQAFTMGSDHALYRIGDGSIVPEDCAVVIMADSASITLSATSAALPSVTGNILRGTIAAANKLNVYVMSQVNGVFGFFEFIGEIPANKAYYVE